YPSTSSRCAEPSRSAASASGRRCGRSPAAARRPRTTPTRSGGRERGREVPGTGGAPAPANSPCSEKPTRTELSMTDKVFCDVSISADGYVAGAGQTADKPFGDGPVDRLHAWMLETPDENRAHIDAIVSAGAFVM